MSNADSKGMCNDCGGSLVWSDSNQDFICHNTSCPAYEADGDFDDCNDLQDDSYRY